MWCAMPHRAAAPFFFLLLLIHFLHTASSGKMTRPQEEVWTAEAEALGLIQCCVWLAATPGDGEMCHGSLAGMKRLVEVEGGDGGHLSPSPPPPSLHPTIVHGSILSLPFLLLSSSILRQPASPCLPARLLRASLHSPHISRLTTAANEGSYLGGGFWRGEGFTGGDKSVVHHFV